MTRLSGYVFDSYDDADGDVLRSVFTTYQELPALVKTAARLTHSQIAELPDDQFALVLFDGSEKLKKYATIDEGNTLLSIVYLLKQAHLLPEEAVKIAAVNLLAACDYYNIEPPNQLKMAAMTGMSPVSGKSQSPYTKLFKAPKASLPSDEHTKIVSDKNPQLGHFDAANDDVSERTNMNGSPGTNFMELPVFPQKEKEKTATLTPVSAQELFNTQSSYDRSEMSHFSNAAQPAKQQSWREIPYFDMTGWDPSMATVEEPAMPKLTLVDGQYPVDSYDQVKTASSYFTENYLSMDPRTRHTYCVKLAHRMDNLEIPVPDSIRRYGSEVYAADVESYVEARRSYVHEEYHDGLDLLLEKRAQVSPGVFAEALAEFDKLAGINWHWDGKIADPWWSTFGHDLTKLAEDNWCFDKDGVRIREEDLEWLVRNANERLVKSFGAEFAKEFGKNPRSVFNSLPDPNKLVLARLASDRYGGTE